MRVQGLNPCGDATPYGHDFSSWRHEENTKNEKSSDNREAAFDSLTASGPAHAERFMQVPSCRRLLKTCECRLMVGLQPSKLVTGVRFPSLAPYAQVVYEKHHLDVRQTLRTRRTVNLEMTVRLRPCAPLLNPGVCQW